VVTFIVLLCFAGYAAIAGAVRAWLHWVYPDNCGGEPEYSLGGVFWPLVLPGVLANYAAKRLFGAVDAKRAAAAKEAEELRRRISELDEELRTAKGTKA